MAVNVELATTLYEPWLMKSAPWPPEFVVLAVTFRTVLLPPSRYIPSAKLLMLQFFIVVFVWLV